MLIYINRKIDYILFIIFDFLLEHYILYILYICTSYIIILVQQNYFRSISKFRSIAKFYTLQ